MEPKTTTTEATADRSSLQYIEAAWDVLPPHVREAIVTLVDGSLAHRESVVAMPRMAVPFRDDVQEATSELSAALWDAAPKERADFVKDIISLSPQPFARANALSRLRACFLRLYESVQGEIVPIGRLRAMFYVQGIPEILDLDKLQSAQGPRDIERQLNELAAAIAQMTRRASGNYEFVEGINSW